MERNQKAFQGLPKDTDRGFEHTVGEKQERQVS